LVNAGPNYQLPHQAAADLMTASSSSDSSCESSSDMEPVEGISAASSALISVNTMLGPGLVAIPAAFQAGGWVPNMIGLTVGGLVTADVAVLFSQTIKRTRAQALARDDLSGEVLPPQKWEFVNLARHLGGPSLERATQILLSVSLLALACAQIIVTAQAMDGLVVWVLGRTYALAPSSSDSWLLVSNKLSVMPFPENTYGVSLGFALNAVVCIALGCLPLASNIEPQYVFFALFNFALGVFIWHFLNPHCDPIVLGDDRLPSIGPNLSGVPGIIIFNYAYIVAVPSLVADTRPKERFGRWMWVAVSFMWLMYAAYGLSGSLAFQEVRDNVLRSILRAEVPAVSKAGVFALSIALQPSIPVYVVLLARNIAEVGIPGPTILANLVPWSLALLCYMQSWFAMIINWSGLLVLGFINYSVPLALVILQARNDKGDENVGDVRVVHRTVQTGYTWRMLRCWTYFYGMNALILACIVWNVSIAAFGANG